MKKVKFLVMSCMLLFASTVFIVGCDEKKDTADKQVAAATEKVMKEMNAQIGIPSLPNFQEKKLLKWIYELCDQENLICHAYYFNALEGKRGDYIGKCLGYGIPYSTQFSNPEKRVDYSKGGTCECDYNTPQAEPNGLFKPEGLSATWLILLDKEGNPHPMYVEPALIVSPIKLH